jgi:hypothetical protein
LKLFKAGAASGAKDETAGPWYLNWEFEPSPSDPFQLFLLIKDIKAMAASE